MPVTRGMIPEKIIKTGKTLGDYVLEGGIKGRIFVDTIYTAPVDTIYEVEKIELMGKGGPRPTVSVVGRVHETGEIYMKNLVNCWDHKEYSGHAQTSPKLTDPLENRCCPDDNSSRNAGREGFEAE